MEYSGKQKYSIIVKIEKNGEVFFDRPKPTAGCRTNGRRRIWNIVANRNTA